MSEKKIRWREQNKMMKNQEVLLFTSVVCCFCLPRFPLLTKLLHTFHDNFSITFNKVIQTLVINITKSLRRFLIYASVKQSLNAVRRCSQRTSLT